MKQLQLANPGLLRDKLVRAVLDGKKTATSSLLSEWQSENEEFPKLGERQTLVNSQGGTVAIVEITSVTQYKLADVDLSVALDEGEGFSTIADWRQAHEDFWKPQIVNDNTVIVVERFKLVKKL